MTNEEAIKKITHIKYCYAYEGDYEAFDMAIKALSADIEEDVARRIATIIENEQDMRVILKNADRPTGWIPIKWHEITEEEREREGYPKDWVVYLDCEMPSDEQKILVTTRWGTVEADVCYEDGEFSLDSGYDWIDDIIAWMPLPEPYREDDELATEQMEHDAIYEPTYNSKDGSI